MSRSASYEGGKGVVQQVVPLGTAAVTTATKIVGAVPKKTRAIPSASKD